MPTGKLNVYNLGALGVNLVDGPIHMKDGELLQCQNAMAMPVEAQIALVKRPGMDFIAGTGGYNWALKSFLTKSYHEVGPPDFIAWRHPAYASTLGRVVSVGGNNTVGRVKTTDDGGLTWVENQGQASNLSWVAVTWAPALGLFCAVAAGSTGGTPKVMTSPDGFTWTARNFATSNADWEGIAWSESLGLFVAVTETGTVPTPLNTSPDGINWTARTGVLGGWRRVVRNDTAGIFLAMGYTENSFPFVGNAHFMTSANGTTGWTDRATTVRAIFNDAVWHPTLNLWIAVGNQAHPSDKKNVATSPDGITWTGLVAADGIDLWCVDYASELGLLVACSSTSYLFSENGTDWWEAAGSELSPTRGSDLIWVNANERFAVAGGNGTGYFELS